MFPILVFLLLSLSLTKGQYEPMAQPGSGVDLFGKLGRRRLNPEAKFVFKKKRMISHIDTEETIEPFQSWSRNDTKPSVTKVSSPVEPKSNVTNPPQIRNLVANRRTLKVKSKRNLTVSTKPESSEFGLDSNLNLTVANNRYKPEPIVSENAENGQDSNLNLTKNTPVFRHHKSKFKKYGSVNAYSVISHKKKKKTAGKTKKPVKKFNSFDIKTPKSALISNLDLSLNNTSDSVNAKSQEVGHNKSKIKESKSLNIGSRRSGSKSEEFGSSLEADVIQNMLSNEDSYQLYKYTDQLMKNLVNEYMNLAMVVDDNSNATKFTYSVIKYFVMQFGIISSRYPSNADDYYDMVYDLALNKTKERRGSSAIQFAAPVRRAADIFVALIDMPINIVQTNCDESEAKCVSIFAEILSKKEVKYCKNALYHAVIFLKVLEYIKDVEGTEVLIEVLKESLPKLNRRGNSQQDDIAKPQKSVLVNPNIRKSNSEISKPDVRNTVVPEKNLKAPKSVTIDSMSPKVKEPPKSVLENPETADVNEIRRRRSIEIAKYYYRKRKSLILESQNSALFDPRVPREIDDQTRTELVDYNVFKEKKVDTRKSETTVEPLRPAVKGFKFGEVDAKFKNDESFKEVFDQVITNLNKQRDSIRNFLEDRIAMNRLIQQYQDEGKLTCLSINREQ